MGAYVLHLQSTISPPTPAPTLAHHLPVSVASSRADDHRNHIITHTYTICCSPTAPTPNPHTAPFTRHSE
ncbi:uncharacterized protein TRAVEDRAFT_28177 [Trametes versicolor FP-101664 SS1]|uniref:uncharacterized protein n=1 Tax=Trametes versicolor (strain FP-101664) TaxID=717944 RepID=UPI0004623A76|nr:uncharacterized protein TRAVEDRAFT_28177 [Trametes versicolor FP-101664 SS1]EIW60661.1 hypothetical protein TRAVEDRAFT_28177 [Trametes versicolor FP-101664 SS1]